MARKSEQIQALLMSIVELQFLQRSTQQHGEEQPQDQYQNQNRDCVFNGALTNDETIPGGAKQLQSKAQQRCRDYGKRFQRLNSSSTRNIKKCVPCSNRTTDQIRKRFLRERLRRWISNSDKRNPIFK